VHVRGVAIIMRGVAIIMRGVAIIMRGVAILMRGVAILYMRGVATNVASMTNQTDSEGE